MDISTEVAAIQAASQGSELRQPLVGALNKLNSGSLPAVTALDAGKILKVGTNGWEVGEKSGYMPVPSAIKQITENGSYDVTDFASAIVSVSGSGGSKNILGGTSEPTNIDGVDGDIYIKYKDYSHSALPDTYTAIEYLGIGNSAGPYINTNYNFTQNSEFELVAQYTGTPNGNSWLFGAYVSGKQTNVGYTQNSIYMQTGGRSVTKSLDTNKHIYKSTQSAFIIDDVVQIGSTPNWSNTTTLPAKLFYIFDGSYSNNCKIYGCKIWDNSILTRNLIPAKRNSDNALGMYDAVNDVFYTNIGNGEFIAGDEPVGTPIETAYLKVNGSWILLEDGDWSDVNTGV